MDVARKLVIVAREMNLNCDISSVEIEELIPSALMNRNHSVDKFLNDLSSVNPIFQEKAYTTLKNRKRLAYLGTVNSNGKIRIALEEVVNDSVFANPKGIYYVILIIPMKDSTDGLIF
jgi:homoserine dehydrogenase